MENLAPAGNRAALERADAAGADAVYLGYSAFSARAGAGNFDRRELEEAIRYAHLRHMRVHVTVNTLIKDCELDEVTEVLRLLRDLQADAVLIQDLGALRIARALFPGLTVHASTQMAIHNRTGVAWCVRQGIRRVVLARECSLEEIRRCRDAGAEIEVFGGDRGFCPRSPVRRGQRTLPVLQHGGRTKRQPGPVRPALPDGIQLPGAQRRLAQPPGRMPAG